MSFSSKLKPRIKPRLGVKVSDERPPDASLPIKNASSTSSSVSSGSKPDATCRPSACLNQNLPSNVVSVAQTCSSTTAITSEENRAPEGNTGRNEKNVTCSDVPHSENSPKSFTASEEIPAPAEKVVSKEENITCTKIPHCPEPDPGAAQNSGQSESSSSEPSKVNKSTINDTQIRPTKPTPQESPLTARERLKSRVMGFKYHKPVIKSQIRPSPSIESPVLVPPASKLESQTIESEATKQCDTPCRTEGSVNNSESSVVEDSSEFSGLSKKSDAQELQGRLQVQVSKETLSPRSNNNRITGASRDIVTSQEKCVSSKPLSIDRSSTTLEVDGIIDLSLQNKPKSDTPNSSCNVGNKIADVLKKHPLIKRPPRIMKKAPKLDRSRTTVSQLAEKPQPDVVAPPEKASSDASECRDQPIIRAVGDEGTDEQNLENVSHNNIPVIDTIKSKNQALETPFGTANSKNGHVTSDSSDKTDPIDDRELSNKVAVEKAKLESPTKSKTAKSDVEDVRTLCAIGAVDYLRRHDHALGDSIIRKLIIGAKNMQNRNLKATMCSSCNPQTLQKCLASLWSFHKDELQVILKKSAERQKAPVSFANFSGKPLFKPSLGRQRAPTLTASTYGKMSFEVKEGLAKKYGLKAPELSKLRMLDLIFYNPSDNPMSKRSANGDSSETSSMKGSPSNISSSSYSKTGRSNASLDQSDSDVDDPDDESDRRSTTSSISAADRNEQNDNAVPVPQVKIGDEGQIILAPESLVLKQRESEVLNNPVVHEGDFSGFVRRKDYQNRTSWCFEETVKFYKALHGMGTDFTSMLTLFPNRSRRNLKSKFKREERKNSALVDKVLGAQGHKLNMADVEKDLATDKALRRIVIQTADRKYSRRDSISSVRKKIEELLDDDEEPDDLWRAAQVAESKPVLASSIPNNSRNRSASTQKATENETEEEHHSENEGLEKEENEVLEEGENSVEVGSDNQTSEKPSEKLQNKELSEPFKRPVGRPPLPLRKRKLDKKVPNIIKRAKKRKTSPPPRIHTICLDDFEDPDGNDSDCESLPESDQLALESSSGRDDCFIIKTNSEHVSFNCIKTVKFSVDNPDLPVDVNTTIEHKSDEPHAEVESEMNESGDVVQVVTININQLPSFLEQTGAVVIETAGSE